MGNTDGKAKYFKLMEALKDDILAGRIKPGEKLPSENELAVRYEISRHTVRKALGILAADGFIEAEHGKGTFCSERMRHMKKSRNIAVVTTYISDYIFPRLIQGIDRVLTEQDYSIILKNTGNSGKNEERCLEDILTKDIDGLIIEPSRSQIYCRHMHLYERLEEYQIPYIFIQGIYPQMKEKPHILMDDCQGGFLLTRHLIDTGHQKIVGIFKADDSQGQQRHRGYVKALQEAGIPYDPDQVIWFHTEDRKAKPVSEIQMMLDEKRRIDGIVCYNDQIAYEIMRTLGENQIRVPEDISITGYDNSFIARNAAVQLTTIAHPQEELGEMAARLLLEQINGVEEKDSRVPRLIEPELVVRNSTRNRLEQKNKNI